MKIYRTEDVKYHIFSFFIPFFFQFLFTTFFYLEQYILHAYDFWQCAQLLVNIPEPEEADEGFRNMINEQPACLVDLIFFFIFYSVLNRKTKVSVNFLMVYFKILNYFVFKLQ